MTTENRGDEQRYDSTAGSTPEPSASTNYTAAPQAGAGGQNAPPYRAAYSPGSASAYPGGMDPGAPNPALAALLGFIPGVGAMYNGQFAKGLAHIGIFAVFCSLSKNVNDLFGLLIAGWVLYMAFEAYQTALARRDGMPLPDPFGLNNIGERFGFRANPNDRPFWAQGGPPPMGTAAPPIPNAYPSPGYTGPPPPPFHVDPSGTVYRADAIPAEPLAWDRPVENPLPGYAAYRPVPPAPGAPYEPAGYGAAPFGVPPMPPVSGSGLPVGAIWLIGLGIFALLGSIRAFDFLEGESTGGIFLIGLSLFLFWRRWNQSRQLYPPESPAARWSVVQGTRGAAVLFVVGLLTLLQGLRIVYWDNSWPFLLIALGVLLLLERVALNRIAAASYAANQPAAQQVEQPLPTNSILPRYPRAGDDTGKEGQ